MATWIVLLRAVNVGGTGRLPMADLRRLAEGAGFRAAKTVLASGNLVVVSDMDTEGEVAARLSAALTAEGHSGDVLVRGPEELARVLAANPFPDADPAKVAIVFLPSQPTTPVVHAGATAGEQVVEGERVVYVFYPEGQGRSKLRLPAAVAGTARNLNTVRKLVALSTG